ncbi:MAG: hypothetical protein AAFP77_12155 [Bacteroidota bacterium]
MGFLNIYLEVLLIVLLIGSVYFWIKNYDKLSNEKLKTYRSKQQIDTSVREIEKLEQIEIQYYFTQKKFEFFGELKINQYQKKVDIDDIQAYVLACLSRYCSINGDIGKQAIEDIVNFYIGQYENDGRFVKLLPSECMKNIVSPAVKYIYDNNFFALLPKSANLIALESKGNKLEFKDENSDFLSL